MPSPTERALEIFAAFEGQHIDRLSDLVTDDVRLQLGNEEPLFGKEAFEQAVQTFLDSVVAFHHDVLSVWHDRDALIVEVEVRYTRLDGREVVLPCCNVFRLRAGLIFDYRTYMDINPVYA
jgi:ketosteroid isomerase-like protein